MEYIYIYTHTRMINRLWKKGKKISKLEQENYFKEKKEVINKPIIPTILETDWFTIFSRERERFLESEREENRKQAWVKKN